MTIKTILVTAVVPVAISSLSSPLAAETLQSVIQEALTNNPQVQANINQQKSRQQELEQARAGYLPNIDLTAGYGREESQNPSTRATGNNSQTKTRSEAAVTLRQMVFDGFATSSEVNRQTARVNSAGFTITSVSENTALRATEVYLQLLRRDELLKLAEDNLQAHQRTYDQIASRSRSGVGRKVDLDQVEGRRALAQSNVIAEKGNFLDAQSNFLRVVGRLPQGDLTRPELDKAKLPANISQAVDNALNSHPTLKSALADVEAAKAQQEAARSPFFPRLDIELGAAANNDLDGQEGTNEEAFAMLRLRYNLFSGGSDSARKLQTAHLLNEAREIRNNTRRQVIESVRLSWNAFDAANMRLTYLDTYVKSTRQTRDAYAKQFNIGQRTLLDLLDSENEYFESQRAFTNAQYDRLFASYRILNGMGQLLEYFQLAAGQSSQ